MSCRGQCHGDTMADLIGDTCRDQQLLSAGTGRSHNGKRLVKIATCRISSIRAVSSWSEIWVKGQRSKMCCDYSGLVIIYYFNNSENFHNMIFPIWQLFVRYSFDLIYSTSGSTTWQCSDTAICAAPSATCRTEGDSILHLQAFLFVKMTAEFVQPTFILYFIDENVVERCRLPIYSVPVEYLWMNVGRHAGCEHL